MAIQISIDGSVTSRKPLLDTFTLKELVAFLGTDDEHIHLLDLGLFIIAVDTTKDRELNSVASLYFRFPIYGSVLAMSSQELPVSTPIITDDNCKYEPEIFDQSFMKSLKDSLLAVESALNNDITVSEQQMPTVKKRGRKKKPKKKLYYFDPDDPTNGVKLSNEEVDFIKEFYHFSYESLENAKKLRNLKLYEAEDFIITFMPGKEEKMLNGMMKYYVEREEYEKCAVIRDKILMFQNESAVQE
jgi:hypothetical protein